jgi:DNA repair protein RadD
MKALWPEQETAVRAVYSALRQPGTCPLLVMPTGTGKSLVIARIIKDVVASGHRVLNLAPKQELVEQNAQEFADLIDIPVSIGVCCAGLGRKEYDAQVTFGTINSAYKDAFSFGNLAMLLIDEAHIMPRKEGSMYPDFLADLTKSAPGCRVVGLTATPYRLDGGHLLDCSIFTKVAYEWTVGDAIKAGRLCPVTSRVEDVAQIDFERIHIRAGDFDDDEIADALMGKQQTIAGYIDQLIEGEARKKAIVFCQTLELAEKLASCLHSPCRTVSYKTPDREREETVAAFRRGDFPVLLNKSVYTTGFNVPDVDLVVLDMATQSPALYVQMIGRGTRLAPGKDSCLVLDFGQNITRHGPIDEISIERREGGGKKGEAREAAMKICPECYELQAVQSKECLACGYEFPANELPIFRHPDGSPLLGQSEWRVVYDTDTRVWTKKDKPPMVRIDLHTSDNRGGGGEVIAHFLCPFHGGYATTKAHQFIAEHVPHWTPDELDTEHERCESLAKEINDCFHPRRIKVKRDGKFWRITAIDRESEAATQHDDEIPF